MYLLLDVTNDVWLEDKKAGFVTCLLFLNDFGAEGGIRTPTGCCPLPPQDSVSTYSTTSA